MKKEQFESFLASVPVDAGDDGWSVAPAERNITLYAAHGGVSLTVSKVDAPQNAERKAGFAADR